MLKWDMLTWAYKCEDLRARHISGCGTGPPAHPFLYGPRGSDIHRSKPFFRNKQLVHSFLSEKVHPTTVNLLLLRLASAFAPRTPTCPLAVAAAARGIAIEELLVIYTGSVSSGNVVHAVGC